MKRLFLSILLILPVGLGLTANLQAQEQTDVQPATTADTTTAAASSVAIPQFGYLSYSQVFEQMPDYQKAKEDFAALKAQYDAEATRAEDEFQRKFSEFLQGQKDFPKSIMQKRQAELQELMDKSINFRKEAQRLLADAEKKLQQPVADRLNAAIHEVAAKQGLIFVLNTDGNAVPFIHPQVGIDVTETVLAIVTQ
ncbi:MAG: OmpH family outer membrane protein [Bacteroidales bacterium]|nr:OmpH family outer membrane protein [Bacteroidales bacterium]